MAEIPGSLQTNAAPIQPVASETVAGPETPHVDLSDAEQANEKVYDVRNKTTISIPHSEVEIAVRSGLYAPLKTREFIVTDTGGQTHGVAGANLKEALDDGNLLASQEDAHAHLINRKYGNSEIRAGVEGVARGVVPYLADKAQQMLGVSQEDMAGREEANPISAIGGEIAGTVVSPLTKIPVFAGASVERVLGKVALKAGLTNKVAQAIVAKVIPKAAGSAVEGAYFGAAHLLNEDALGTAQFNAENLLASAEQGALWGAAFGGGLSATGLAAKGTASAIGESRAGKFVANKFDDALGALNNTEKAAREFLGIEPSMAKNLAKRDPEFMADTIKWTQEVLTENKSASIEEVGAKLKSDKGSIGKQIGGISDEVDKAGVAAKKSYVISADDLKFKIASKIESDILPDLAKVEGSAQQIKITNKKINEILGSGLGDNVSLTAKELHEKLTAVSEQMKFDKPVVGLTLNQEMLKVQREVIREELNNAVKLAASAKDDAGKLLHPEMVGKFEELMAANRRYRTLSSLEKAVEGRVNDAAVQGSFTKSDIFTTVAGAYVGGPLGASAVVAKKFLESDMLRKMQILGKIEKFQQLTQSAISSGFKAMGRTVDKVAPKAELVATKSLVDSHLSSELVDGKKKKAADEQQAYRNILANAKFAAENPEQFLKGVNKYTGHLYGVAPQTSGALDTAALNALVFLHTKAPKSSKAKGMFDASKADRASGHEMLKLQQRLDMISKPTKAIQLLHKGKLGATHVETLKAVYPEMHAEMQKQAMNFINSKDGAKLSYGQKLNLATLLGVQADESMHFNNVLGLQANFDTKGADEASGGVVGATQGGLAKVNKANRMDNDDSNDT